ncbi:hypothetical protein FHH43_11485 [Clostridium perfringens]|nr:hypothetical protein [Clostridium perfringens]
MEKLDKKKAKKDAEKRYEFKFYRYLGLILLILFSCILTLSNLISPGETGKEIAEIVRNDYSEFFQYEIHNSKKDLVNIYDDYSEEHNVKVEKLIAVNVIYFGQDGNRYLEPYLRPYIDNYNLSKEDKEELYKQVDREIKIIENKCRFKLIVKRFSPYVLSIIFITIMMASSSFIKNISKKEKNMFGVLILLIGTYICYLSLINIKYGICINIAIIYVLVEFIIENKSKLLVYTGLGLLICLVFGGLFIKFQNKATINLEKYNNDNLVFINNLETKVDIKDEQAVQRIGRTLFSEIKKEKLIKINESKDEVDKLLEEKNRFIFKDKTTNEPVLYMYLYNKMPIYRIVFIKNSNSIEVYEGVLNPYMRSTLRKFRKEKNFKKEKLSM